MGKVSIDLSSLKAAGIYTLEVDNSQRTVGNTNALRLVVGFANRGAFNRPVLLEQDTDRLKVFGDVDTKLEHKGCFFNRHLRTLLASGQPVIALNLLKVDHSFMGDDQVNYAAMSLDAAIANPAIKRTNVKHGEYDYLADSVDKVIYGTAKGDNVPYIGATPFSSVYNRSRFWIPDKDLLTACAARGLQTADYSNDRGTFEYTNLLNFANVGTEEFSLLVFKPTNMNGYDVTAETWYGGKENIPFGWIRPYDYVSDYFLQVVCIKGNWSNYAVLSTDPIWSAYFDKKGIIKDKVNSFMGAEGITILGSWTGIIIPDFTDKQGNNLSLEKKINSATERTGLLMSLNNDAMNVLTYDYSGAFAEEEDPDSGAWGIDIDGNGEINAESENPEDYAPYVVDMCGHEAFMAKESAEVEYEVVDLTDYTIPKNASVNGTRNKKIIVNVAPANMILAKGNAEMVDCSVKIDKNTFIDCSAGVYVDASVMIPFDTEAEAIKINDISDLDYTLKNYFTSNYYEITTPSGTVRTYLIDSIEFDYTPKNGTGALNGDIDVVAYLEYANVKAKYTFVISIDDAGYLKNIDTTAAEYSIAKDQQQSGEDYYGINFLSYNYIQEEGDGVVKTVDNVAYFSDPTLWNGNCPVNDDIKNMFIITSANNWMDEDVKVGDYVQNITYRNESGETNQYKLIPGLSRVIKKQFVKVEMSIEGNPYISYKGVKYEYLGSIDKAKNNNKGFYLITCTAPVLIEDSSIVRQLPISDNAISHSLRFIPLKGLALSSRHRPGYDAEGNLDIEAGIEKIYSVIEDEGIWRGLMNSAMVNYRYIVDTMSYGLEQEMGGKVHISRAAMERTKTTACLSLPSAKQFAVSSNPYFCDTYIPGSETRPGLNTKYIAAGGNTEMGSTALFTLPSQDDGAKFTACFWPNVIYTEKGKNISVPPAADACNVLSRKFTGVQDAYAICANQDGILSNKYLTDVEFYADIEDRKYLEPMGVNTIIKDGNDIMIYGNQTAYQDIKSDLNKLHVRENLNTAEIECEAILKKYNFKYNTEAVRANIVSALTPVLQVMQTSGAIAKYEIICDETNNTPEVIEADTCVINVDLWFNHGMEKICQIFTVNRYSTLATEA